MRIESISIKNFKGFRNAVMTDIPPFCVVIGANGSGKSTLFDVFGFLRDCLKNDVIRALQAWGGFSQVISRKTGFQTASLRFRHGCGKAGCKKGGLKWDKTPSNRLLRIPIRPRQSCPLYPVFQQIMLGKNISDFNSFFHILHIVGSNFGIRQPKNYTCR